MKRATRIRQHWTGPGWSVELVIDIVDATGTQIGELGEVVSAIETYTRHLPDARVATPTPPRKETTDG